MRAVDFGVGEEGFDKVLGRGLVVGGDGGGERRTWQSSKVPSTAMLAMLRRGAKLAKGSKCLLSTSKSPYPSLFPSQLLSINL